MLWGLAVAAVVAAAAPTAPLHRVARRTRLRHGSSNDISEHFVAREEA